MERHESSSSSSFVREHVNKFNSLGISASPSPSTSTSTSVTVSASIPTKLSPISLYDVTLNNNDNDSVSTSHHDDGKTISNNSKNEQNINVDESIENKTSEIKIQNTTEKTAQIKKITSSEYSEAIISRRYISESSSSANLANSELFDDNCEQSTQKYSSQDSTRNESRESQLKSCDLLNLHNKQKKIDSFKSLYLNSNLNLNPTTTTKSWQTKTNFNNNNNNDNLIKDLNVNLFGVNKTINFENNEKQSCETYLNHNHNNNTQSQKFIVSDNNKSQIIKNSKSYRPPVPQKPQNYKLLNQQTSNYNPIQFINTHHINQFIPKTSLEYQFGTNKKSDRENLLISENQQKFVERNAQQEENASKRVDQLTEFLIKSMAAAEDDDFFGMCHKCGDKVIGEGNGCTAMDRVYHCLCFTCSVCKQELRGKQFYAIDDNPYCEDDYLETLEKCCVCNSAIKSKILRAQGKAYHPSCFTCTVCHKVLDNVPFTVSTDGKIHCIEDFHKKFAPKCSVCTEPIVPEPDKQETVRIVALDRSFHIDCYRCESCNLLLSSEAEGHGCYPLDGHILCRDCNIKRAQAAAAVAAGSA